MDPNPHNRRFERALFVSFALLAATLLGLLTHAGMHPLVVA